MLELNKIHLGDCLELMKQIPDKSIDLVLADPPYFEVRGEFDFIRNSFEEYLSFVETVAIDLKRILKDNGSLYWFGSSKNIAYQQVIFDKYFNLENNLVRKKEVLYGATGNDGMRSFAPCTERVLFYSNEIVSINGLCIFKTRDYIRKCIEEIKGKVVLKQINQVLGTADNGGGVASACLSLEKKEPLMITEEHFIKLFKRLYPHKEYEDLRKEYEDLRKEYEDLRRPFNQLGLSEVIEFSNDMSLQTCVKFKHETVKPVNLIKALVETSSRLGSIVLDPFLGSGTTAVACKQMGRNFIGIEKEKKYVDIANKRLQYTQVALF